MFIFLILGLVFSIITVLVVKDMKIYKECYIYNSKPISFPLWAILLLCLSYFIPIMGIVAFVGFNIWFIIICSGGIANNIVILNQKNLFHRIFLEAISILNKTIN